MQVYTMTPTFYNWPFNIYSESLSYPARTYSPSASTSQSTLFTGVCYHDWLDSKVFKGFVLLLGEVNTQ